MKLYCVHYSVKSSRACNPNLNRWSGVSRWRTLSVNVGIATQNINAALFVYLFLATPELKPAFHRGTSRLVSDISLLFFLKIETTIKKIFNTEFQPGSKNVSPEKSCTKITKQSKIKSQVIFIACCLFLHTSDSAWSTSLHTTKQARFSVEFMAVLGSSGGATG